MIPLEGQQLVESVDLHELQARGRKDVGSGNGGSGGFQQPVRPGIPVTDRIGEQGVVGCEEAVIDPPRVDADTADCSSVPPLSEP